MSTVSAFQALQVLEGLERMGAPTSRAEICRAVGLDADELAEPGCRIPLAAFGCLMEEAERVTGDPLAALHAAEASGPRGLLSYLSLAQPTVEDAIEAFGRFAAVAGDGLVIALQRGPTHAAIRVENQSYQPDRTPAAQEYTVAMVVLALRQAATPGVRPAEVRFPHARRGPEGEVERVLGAPVRFRQPACEIVLSAGDLSRRLGRANPQMARTLEGEAERELAPVGEHDTLTRVAEAIRTSLLGGDTADPARIARGLGTSVRTLQRQLADEGTQFKAVREAVRRELAETLLDDASVSVSEVADRLGFADVAGFGKAFKRWTGASPRDWRRIRNEACEDR